MIKFKKKLFINDDSLRDSREIVCRFLQQNDETGFSRLKFPDAIHI